MNGGTTPRRPMTIARPTDARPWTSVAVAIVTITLLADIAAVGVFVATVSAGSAPTLDAFSVGGMVIGLTYGLIGWVVASRRPDNAIGWVFLAIGLSQAFSVFTTSYATFGLVVAAGSVPFAAELSWVAAWVWAPGFSLLVTLSVLLFPDGRPPSPRWRPVVWASLAVMALVVVPIAVATWPLRGLALMGPSIEGLDPIALQVQTAGIVAIPFVALASIAGMVVRFRRAGPIERQQLKWFTHAALPEIAYVVSTAFITVPLVVAGPASVLIAPLLPVAAAVAIFRYRLYEIDRIVSRTIAYAFISAILALVFAGLVLALQAALAPLTQGNTVAVAISTLIVFALFEPVRGRVKALVDRRFNRARIDGERAATSFAERLRDQFDMPSVVGDLTATTNRAVEPRALGVWLRDPVTIHGRDVPMVRTT